MEISIKKTAELFQFTAANGQAEVPLCASPTLGATQDGFRPMELLLVGLGSCMSIDVLNILYKQKQTITDYEVKVSANRTDEVPSLFESILIEIYVSGDVDQQKLERAIALSEDKYCSVHKILGHTASIQCKYYLNHGE